MKELDSHDSTESGTDHVNHEPTGDAHASLSELLAALSIALPSTQPVRHARADVVIIPEVRTNDIHGVIHDGYRHGLSLVARASAKAATAADAVSATSRRIHQLANERLDRIDE